MRGGCATCSGSGRIRVLGRPPSFCSCAAGLVLRLDAEGPPPPSAPRPPTITDAELEELRADAIVSGDLVVVTVCESALEGVDSARATAARWLAERRSATAT